MANRLTFVNAGKIVDIKEQGCLKTKIHGRYVMVCYLNGEFIAIDIGKVAEKTGNHSIPADLFGMTSLFSSSPESSIDADWGRLVLYPVKIDDENIFVGSNPI